MLLLLSAASFSSLLLVAMLAVISSVITSYAVHRTQTPGSETPRVSHMTFALTRPPCVLRIGLKPEAFLGLLRNLEDDDACFVALCIYRFQFWSEEFQICACPEAAGYLLVPPREPRGRKMRCSSRWYEGYATELDFVYGFILQFPAWTLAGDIYHSGLQQDGLHTQRMWLRILCEESA